MGDRGLTAPVAPVAARRRLSHLAPLEAAVVETVCYADVFDWPLTAEEIHRFLPIRAGAGEVAEVLRAAPLRGIVTTAGGWHALAGRGHLAGMRHRRAERARTLLPVARRCAARIARIPWVRMVALTGSMAAGAARAGDDIDLFIVTDDGRLWISRAATLVLARSMRGSRLCPNYMVCESAMELPDRDIYTAHELAQLIPLWGAATYAAFLESNRWYRDHLPNHPGFEGTIPGAPPARARRRSEGGGGRRSPGVVARLESWEMRRKVARLTARGAGAEVHFSDTVVKGHVDGHRRRFWAAFDARLSALEAMAS